MQKQQLRAGARRNMVKGGMVQGPGTGTSDSVPSSVAGGSYVVPADTTQKVRLSNGEHVLNPVQVHSVGVAALDALRGMTHKPVGVGARRPVPGAGQPPDPDNDADTPGNDPDGDGMRNGGPVRMQQRTKPPRMDGDGDFDGDTRANDPDGDAGMVKTVKVKAHHRHVKVVRAGARRQPASYGIAREGGDEEGPNDAREDAAEGTSEASEGAEPAMADGGIVGSIKNMLGMGGPPETITQKYARQDAENQARWASQAPAPAPAPAPALAGGTSAISNYAGGMQSTLQRREAEAGLADGGLVPSVKKGARRNREPGYANGTPGGIPMSDEDRKALINQIPADTAPNLKPADPNADTSDTTDSEAWRNVKNTVYALPGAGGLLEGGAALAGVASKVAPIIGGAIGLGARAGSKVLPYAAPATGLVAIKQGMASENAAAAPAAAPAPASTAAAQPATAAPTPAAAAPASAPAAAAASATADDSGLPSSSDNIATMNRAGQTLNEIGALQTSGAYAQPGAMGASPGLGYIPPDPAIEQRREFDRTNLMDKMDEAIRHNPGARGARMAAVYGGALHDLEGNAQSGANVQTQEQGQVARTSMQEQGQNQRSGATIASNEKVQSQKNQLAAAEAAPKIGVDRQRLADARILSNLQQQYTAATDDATRSSLAEQIRTLQGKTQNRFTVVPGGQTVDPTTGMVVRSPSSVVNNETGQLVPQSDGASAKPAALPPKDKLVAGQTYDTPRGKARWDGQKFLPVTQ